MYYEMNKICKLKASLFWKKMFVMHLQRQESDDQV